MNKCFGFGKAWISDNDADVDDDCLKCKKTKINEWEKCKNKTNQLTKDANLTDEEVEEYIKKKKENI